MIETLSKFETVVGSNDALFRINLRKRDKDVGS